MKLENTLKIISLLILPTFLAALAVSKTNFSQSEYFYATVVIPFAILYHIGFILALYYIYKHKTTIKNNFLWVLVIIVSGFLFLLPFSLPVFWHVAIKNASANNLPSNKPPQPTAGSGG